MFSEVDSTEARKKQRFYLYLSKATFGLRLSAWRHSSVRSCCLVGSLTGLQNKSLYDVSTDWTVQLMFQSEPSNRYGSFTDVVMKYWNGNHRVVELNMRIGKIGNILIQFTEMNFSGRSNFRSAMKLSKFDPRREGWDPASQKVGNITLVWYTILEVSLEE